MAEAKALDLVADVLAGDVHAIARLMSRAEEGAAADRPRWPKSTATPGAPTWSA